MSKENNKKKSNKKDSIDKIDTKKKDTNKKDSLKEVTNSKETKATKEERIIEAEFDYNEDLEEVVEEEFDDEEEVAIEAVKEETKSNKKDTAKEETVRIEKVPSKKNIEKIEKMAKEKKNKEKKHTTSKFNNFVLFFEKNHGTIYGFIGGLLLATLIAFIIWPERIATLKNGEQSIVKVGGKNYTANELYESMKDYYSVSGNANRGVVVTTFSPFKFLFGGLNQGMVIVAVNGVGINSMYELDKQFSRYEKGDSVCLKVIKKNGKESFFYVEL